MDKMLSVIIPVYNVEQYIDRCISSIVEQTYRNLEIVLVDDGSTDASGRLCDIWAQKDDRIIAVHKRNGGVSSARNAALEMVTGDYITFVDADDWVDETAYEKILKAIHDSRAEAALFGYARVYLDQRMGTNLPKEEEACVTSWTALEKCLRNGKYGGGYCVTVWNKVFRSDLIKGEGGTIYFDEKVTVAEDEIWLYHVFKKDFQVYCNPKTFYFYRERTESALGKRDSGTVNRQSTDNLRARRMIRTLIRQYPYPHRIEVLANTRMFYYTYQFCLNGYGDMSKKLRKIVRQNFCLSLPDYLRSDDYSFLGKMRMVLVLLMLWGHFPRKAIDWVVKL